MRLLGHTVIGYRGESIGDVLVAEPAKNLRLGLDIAEPSFNRLRSNLMYVKL